MDAFPHDGSLFDVERPVLPVDLPARLSPSRAADFTQCPLMFRLRVIDKIPEPPSLAATRGTLVHAVLERLFDLPIGQRTPEQAAALIEPQWEKLVARHPEQREMFATAQELADWLASAKTLLGRYFTLEDPNRLEPAERELFVRAEIGPQDSRLELRGVVDRLDVAPGNLLRVVDYKTGKAPAPGYEAKTLFQMKFYALILWRSRGTIPKRLQLIFMGSGDVLTYDPTEKDLLGTEKKITAIWQAISSAAQNGLWPATPTKLCGWCSFKPICPAHGGTCPPVPEVNLVPARSAEQAGAAGSGPATVPAPAQSPEQIVLGQEA